MKADKAFMRLGGIRLIERVLHVITPLFSEVLINSNTPQQYAGWRYPIIPDVIPNNGSLGGIYSGVKAAQHENIFCVACDMPFLHQGLIRHMQHTMQDNIDALIPRTADGFHPLHAIYSKQCLPVIEALLEQEQLKISNIFPRVRTVYVEEACLKQFDPQLGFFLNLNTWQDVMTAQSKIENLDV